MCTCVFYFAKCVLCFAKKTHAQMLQAAWHLRAHVARHPTMRSDNAPTTFSRCLICMDTANISKKNANCCKLKLACHCTHRIIDRNISYMDCCMANALVGPSLMKRIRVISKCHQLGHGSFSRMSRARTGPFCKVPKLPSMMYLSCHSYDL